MNWMKRPWIILVIIGGLMLAACAPETTPEPAPPTESAEIAAEEQAPTLVPATETAVPPTSTPLPTNTPQPSPSPTPTEEPTMTSTPEPMFVELFQIKNNPDAFKQPYGIAVDSMDNLFVFDAGNGRLLKYDSDGNFLQLWDTQGSEPGQFNSMGFGDIAIDANDNLFVVDNGNFRIQKFDSSGNFVTAWGQ